MVADMDEKICPRMSLPAMSSLKERPASPTSSRTRGREEKVPRLQNTTRQPREATGTSAGSPSTPSRGSRASGRARRTEVKLQDLPVVLGACYVLHNICESHGEEMDPSLRCELNDDETVSENPVRSETASKARDDIAHNLLHSGLVGNKFI